MAAEGAAWALGPACIVHVLLHEPRLPSASWFNRLCELAQPQLQGLGAVAEREWQGMLAMQCAHMRDACDRNCFDAVRVSVADASRLLLVVCGAVDRVVVDAPFLACVV